MKRAVVRTLSAAAIAIGLSMAGCSRAEQLSQARGRANEASALATLRTVLSAEAAYSSAAGGFGSLECLASPKSCVPDDAGQAYLDQGFLTGARSGYEFEFVAGPDSPGARGRAGARLASFAVVATPEDEDSPNRSFCGDSSMNVCELSEDDEVSGGKCPAACTPVR